jgi:general secretion pathway protein I
MGRWPFLRPTREARGFTLVEVLVALAVLAIALAACMRALTQAVDTSAQLRDHTLALWVAQNRLTLHRLRHDWPEPQDTDGVEEAAGRKWYWREHVLNTPETTMRRIELDVKSSAMGAVDARLVGFLRKP